MTKEKRRVFYLKNKKRIYLSHRKWAEKNAEKLREYRKKYWSSEVNKQRRRDNYRKRIEHYKKCDKDHYIKTRARHRELHMAKRYKISVEKYRELFEYHKSLCAICGNPETVKNKVLSVDHNHKTGQVRGLLCGHCNRAIGYLREDLSLLPKVEKYLKSYETPITTMHTDLSH